MKTIAQYSIDGELLSVAVASPRRRRPRYPGWTRVPSLFPVYDHVSGWQVQHCGHATALYPYLAVSPDGSHTLPAGGKCFGTLVEAMAAVEREVAGGGK